MTLFANQFIPSLGEGLDWSLRTTIVFALAGLLGFILRRRSAAARHLVWSAALLGVLALPLARWALPGWRLQAWSTAASVPAEHGTWLAFYRDDAATSTDPAEVPHPAYGGPSARTLLESPSDGHLPVSFGRIVSDATVIVPAIWLLGTVTFLLSIGFGLASLARLRRTSRPLPRELADELSQLARELELRRRVEGLLSRSRSIPMTWGSIRPVVLLPSEAVGWSRQRRRMVLLHELAHVRRWDFAVQLLGQVSRAIHWFNPLAWLALSRLRLEQERACDDCVLNAGQSAADYAAELMTVTARMPQFAWDGTVALAIRQFARIEQRVLGILDTTRDRRPLSRLRAMEMIGAIAVFVALVAIPRWPTALAEDVARDAAASGPAVLSQDDSKAVENGQAQSDQAQEKGANAPDSDGERALARVGELIRDLSPTEIDDKLLTEGAIRGMLESLHDPFSELLSGNQSREIQLQLQGEIVGIGVQLALEQGAIVVVTPLPNSPAAKVGLKPRDTIVAVDGKELNDLKQAVNAIRGVKGSEVKLQINRAGQEVSLTVRRDSVQLVPLKGLLLDAEGRWQHWLDAQAKIGYVQIVEFNHRADTEMEQMLARLHEQGLKGLILDLRGCPGGLLDESVKVASLFLKEGTVASVRGRQQKEQKIDVDGSAKFADLPLLAIVDNLTASAAEVLAAALQDHGRAIVIGERTVGKGTVQSLFPVSELDANLKITTAHLRRANGAPLHRAANASVWGVDPNDGFYVPLTTEQRAAYRDRRAQRDLFGATTLPESPTAADVISELADPALAAALQSMSMKLKTGQFEPTGRPLTEMRAELAERESLRHERDQLLEKLRQIEKQLGSP
jgi:carboxyl-terminal processing protease